MTAAKRFVKSENLVDTMPSNMGRWDKSENGKGTPVAC